MKAVRTLLGLAVVLALVAVVRADKDKDKEVTLKGEFACGKCVLKLDKEVTKGKCINAITVKEDGKEFVYILDDNGGKEKYHKDICTGTKKGSVTGVVTQKPDGDKPGKIKPSKDGVKYED
jgi:hypothetical protein